jgi:hypothetical protein
MCDDPMIFGGWLLTDNAGWSWRWAFHRSCYERLLVMVDSAVYDGPMPIDAEA